MEVGFKKEITYAISGEIRLKRSGFRLGRRTKLRCEVLRE
ncbi:hypothetical protein SAMN02745219_03412 [Desulfofundulus thermosubterraneus DSM 16057]|uniref:Uncharacterized protein n=1 Tax=Desulfofundulus thermosubterraneus DSM 16057 TaxID=1121432 RepID=A0A1M6MDZ3_9FIRM|nr:hypothetical protein SAMN02745219_03412 [Desulfofundulus thermosubterraneus DSM 16057]